MPEKLCLQWNDFKENAINAFGNLRETSDFADVTLACEDGNQIEVHKLILASSSPFFQNLLKRNKHPHPLIYMRAMKSDDLFAIVDFLYRGKANVYQENLDSFLAIAEELQLKGLMGKADDDEMTQTEIVKIPVSKKVYQTHSKEVNILKSSSQFPKSVTEEIIGNDRNEVGRTLAQTSYFSGDLTLELDEKCNSMMEKTSKKVENTTNPCYRCNVCGKEATNGNVKKHIEANHLEGVSIPCNSCEKTFGSRHSLAMHIRRNHKNL